MDVLHRCGLREGLRAARDCSCGRGPEPSAPRSGSSRIQRPYEPERHVARRSRLLSSTAGAVALLAALFLAAPATANAEAVQHAAVVSPAQPPGPPVPPPMGQPGHAETGNVSPLPTGPIPADPNEQRSTGGSVESTLSELHRFGLSGTAAPGNSSDPRRAPNHCVSPTGHAGSRPELLPHTVCNTINPPAGPAPFWGSPASADSGSSPTTGFRTRAAVTGFWRSSFG
ncbi:hypothetical protein Ae707Ps1_6178 [Pseudonocardia sp. Ae707_Ps1]|nr:hypothetical protein Ae707Ps1_6178 [Pseudonocardia sp. Ae707_Ps1]